MRILIALFALAVTAAGVGGLAYSTKQKQIGTDKEPGDDEVDGDIVEAEEVPEVVEEPVVEEPVVEDVVEQPQTTIPPTPSSSGPSGLQQQGNATTKAARIMAAY